jgi:hypothetical protein
MHHNVPRLGWGMLHQDDVSRHVSIHMSCHISSFHVNQQKWPMVKSIDLEKCIRKPSGIVDHSWYYGRASTKVIEISIRQRRSPTIDD